jgi:MoxR-like ATPase
METDEQMLEAQPPEPQAEVPTEPHAEVQPEPPAPTNAASTDTQAVEFCKDSYARIQYELSKVIVGQADVVQEILIAIFTRSHALLVGVPGLAKTLLISTLAQTLQMSFRRIQFTPDLMPSDITGTEVIYQDPLSGLKEFKFLPGPLFSNVVLADEINRTPPKTQAAMLEAMQERRVTVGGNTRDLPAPFFVLATQNPLEQEGTYPLPEAQLDRFLFLINVDYPSEEEELLVMKMGTGMKGETPQPVLTAEQVIFIQQTVKQIPVPDHVYRYAERIVRCTRPKSPAAFDFCKKWLTFGAGSARGPGPDHGGEGARADQRPGVCGLRERGGNRAGGDAASHRGELHRAERGSYFGRCGAQNSGGSPANGTAGLIRVQ